MRTSQYIHECIGTYALVLVGTGAIIANDTNGGTVSHVGISLAFGLVVLAMIYAIGDVSGAHINPAVSFGFLLAGRIGWRMFVGYVVCQVLGGLAASYTLRWLMPAHETLGATLPSITPVKAFVFEAILTFILMFVITRVASGSKEKGVMAGVAIGSTVAFEALFAGPFTGASMNPARSIGPAVASGHLEHLWVYIAAPVVGAGLAVLLCHFMKMECCPKKDNSTP